MVWEEGPGVDVCPSSPGHFAEAGDEGLAVRVVLHDGASFQTTDDDVVECPGRIQPGLARHGDLLVSGDRISEIVHLDNNVP
jgi:hypothetical protein